MTRLTLVLAFLLCAAPISASAQHTETGYMRAPAAPEKPQYNAEQQLQEAYLVPYVGYFDIGAEDNSAAQFGLEYRMAPRFYGLRPTFGFNVTTDESLYGYAGVNWDLNLWDSGFWFTPNFVVGAYEDGEGKDLGGTVEFRSGLELSYDVYQGQRVGIAFNHISNASMYNKNPGAETLLINYHLPFSW